MLRYIGDISAADAEVLADLAEDSTSILEFGCGASTQVMAHYKGIGLMVSVDTDQGWIEKTKGNLKILGIQDEVGFSDYYKFMDERTPKGPFDFIFVDGVDALRREFAIKIWPYLQVDGTMAFHDTRRAHDFRNVLEVLANFQNEVGMVSFNYDGSNITLIQKKELEPYDNWQITENKQPWQLGYGEIPAEELVKIKEQA